MQPKIRRSDLESEGHFHSIANRVRARPLIEEHRLHTLYSKVSADSNTIWYEIWLAAETNGPARVGGIPDLSRARDVDGKHYLEFHVCDVEWTADVRGEQTIRRAGAYLGKALGVPFRLCHEPDTDWTETTPYEHIASQSAILELREAAPFAVVADGIASCPLPPGFVQQLSCLKQDDWNSASPQCRTEDFRTYELLKSYKSRVDPRTFFVVDLPGPASILASLALAEAGWAPCFLLGPMLRLGWDWQPVVSALKYVSKELVATVKHLGANAPIAFIGCVDAGTLNHRRFANEPAELQPLVPEEHPEWVREIMRSSKAKRDFDDKAAIHRRAIFPSMAEIGKFHANATWVHWSDGEEIKILHYEHHKNGLHSDFFSAGINVDGMLINPFASS